MTLGWIEKDNSLYRKFEFANFAEAFEFMTKVAAVAELQNHHPDWSNSWNIVEISLCSHDRGTITQRDHDLANAIDELLA